MSHLLHGLHTINASLMTINGASFVTIDFCREKMFEVENVLSDFLLLSTSCLNSLPSMCRFLIKVVS